MGVVAPPTASFPGPGQVQMPGSGLATQGWVQGSGESRQGRLWVFRPLAAACAWTEQELVLHLVLLLVWFPFCSGLHHHSVEPLELLPFMGFPLR